MRTSAQLFSKAIQGVGGGGIVSLTMIVIADLVPLRQRGAYNGLIGAYVCLPWLDTVPNAHHQGLCGGFRHWPRPRRCIRTITVAVAIL